MKIINRNFLYSAVIYLALAIYSFISNSYALEIENSSTNSFLPNELAKDQLWLEIYGAIPFYKIKYDAKNFMPLIEDFSWWCKEILNPNIVIKEDYISKNIIMIPSTEFKDHNEDIAYLRFSYRGMDCLITQTGGASNGKLFIFIKTKIKKNIELTGIAKWESVPEYVKFIKWSDAACFIINKEVYREKTNQVVAWAGPEANKWFDSYKTRTQKEPEREISFEEICGALEKLPPELRFSSLLYYNRIIESLKNHELSPVQRKSLEFQRNLIAKEILQRATQSKYSEEERKKEYEEFDKKVADAMELVRLFYKNGYKENYWEEYHKLRKAFDNSSNLTSAQRIELDSKIHSAAAPILSEAQYLEQYRNGKEYRNKIKSLEKDFLSGEGVVWSKAFEELKKENRMEIIVKGLSRQDDFSVKLMAAEAIKKAPYIQFLPDIVAALKADNTKIEGSESEIITQNNYKKDLIEAIEKLTKEHSEITDYNNPLQVENIIKQTEKFLKEKNQKENQ